jgi:hypothetical protein
MELVALFYLVDEFCKSFEPDWRAQMLVSGERHRRKPSTMSLAEVLTVLIYFHMSNHRTFKHYYTDYVRVHLHSDFPRLVSYGRFVELTSEASIPLLALLMSLFGSPTHANFVDSTTLDVCDNRRIWKHRVFKGIAARGKSSMGWFYGLKLHLIVNERGEIISFLLTPGNVPDNNQPLMHRLTRRLNGTLFADRGYISHELFLSLLRKGTRLITGIRRNMKNCLMPLWDKLMLRKRSIIETINDQLKNTQQIEHTRHRSPTNFVSNLLSGLIAYQLQPKKPAIHYTRTEQRLLTQPLLTEV